MVWLIILILAIVIEGLTTTFFSIWFGMGALFAFVANKMGLPFFAQVSIFLIIALICLLFVRKVVIKYFKPNHAKTNVDSLVGKHGLVIQRISNLDGTGRVSLNGVDWSARSENDTNNFFEGETVTVIRIEGVKVIVKKEEEATK